MRTRIEVRSNPDSASLFLDNNSIVKTPVVLDVPRSYHDFNLVLKKDSIKKTVLIYSRLSPEFKWGNLFLFNYAPIGYIVDAMSREKMYTYDKSIMVDMKNNRNEYKKWYAYDVAPFRVTISIPWFDFVGLENGFGYTHYNSFVGLTAGVEFYHSKHSFWSFSGGFTGVSDMGFPVERFYDSIPKVNSFKVQYRNAVSAKLTNNHDLNIFPEQNINLQVGYGLSFTNFTYSYNYDSIDYHKSRDYRKSISTLGLCFDSKLTFLRTFYFGVTVLPSFYTITRHKWEYSSLIYLDFGVRIPIGKIKKSSLKVVRYKPKLLE